MHITTFLPLNNSRELGLNYVLWYCPVTTWKCHMWNNFWLFTSLQVLLSKGEILRKYYTHMVHSLITVVGRLVHSLVTFLTYIAPNGYLVITHGWSHIVAECTKLSSEHTWLFSKHTWLFSECARLLSDHHTCLYLAVWWVRLWLMTAHSWGMGMHAVSLDGWIWHDMVPTS